MFDTATRNLRHRAAPDLQATKAPDNRRTKQIFASLKLLVIPPCLAIPNHYNRCHHEEGVITTDVVISAYSFILTLLFGNKK